MAQTEALSPPVVEEVISHCARAVAVSGLIAGATVRIFANGTEEVGSATPYLGWWHIPTRPLVAGEVITAVQEVGGNESFPSRRPVKVQPLTEAANPMSTPEIRQPVYDCQQSVTVEKIHPGVRVEILRNQPDIPQPQAIGYKDTPVAVTSVRTAKLSMGHVIAAKQTLCESNVGGPGPSITVQPRPANLPTPAIDDYLPGAKVLVVRGLVTGAEVEIFVGSISVGGGIAPSADVAFRVSSLAAGRPRARQALCETRSNWSPEAEPLTSLPFPRIRQPVCPGATAVFVEGTVLGETVTVELNGQQVGQVTAVGDTTLVTFGDFVSANVAGLLVAKVEAQGLPHQVTNAVPVSGPGSMDGPIIDGGLEFFEPAANEDPIPGPVIPRGRWTTVGPGPCFRVALCGASRAVLTIHPPGDGTPFDLPLKESPEGQFSAVWDWTKTPRQAIAVGRYEAHFLLASPTQTINTHLPFFIIFDPEEVTAPSRFAFNHTAVWFAPGTPTGKDVLSDFTTGGLWGQGRLNALPYSLHLSDNRVFDWAIKEINGLTDQSQAAKKLLEAEFNRFQYSLAPQFGDYDVVTLLTKATHAQCADDACMLTALLRSVGIPAHPVTADARVELGKAKWRFDTWVEARLTGYAGERWYALHSHSDDDQAPFGPRGPATRTVAGTWWPEADRTVNDMVVMAGPAWNWGNVGDAKAEVTYPWTTPCLRPDKTKLVSEPWIENLTDQEGIPDRYWDKAYWECSPAWEPPIQFRIENKTERQITGTVEVQNTEDEELSGSLQLFRAESSPASMAFAETMEMISSTSIVVPPGARATVPFSASLPASVCADWDNFLVAVFGDDRGIHHIGLQPAIGIEVEPLPELVVGGTAEVRVTLTNQSLFPATNIELALDLPPAVARRSTLDGGLAWRFPQIAPGSSKTATCTILAVQPAEAASVTLRINTDQAGRRETRVPLHVRDWRVAKPARPTPAYYAPEQSPS